MLIVAIVLALPAAALLTFSTSELARANPTTSFPLWSNPPRRPRRVIALRACGAGLTALSTIIAGDSIGYWSILFVPAAFLGTYIVHIAHNRTIRTPPKSHGRRGFSPGTETHNQ